MNKSDKTTLLLIMETIRFGVIKNVTLIAFKTSTSTASVNSFFELQQMLKMSSTSRNVLIRPPFKTSDSFVLQ